MGMESVNHLNFMIMGEPGTGKTTCLRTINNQEDWVYFCTEGKPISFKGSKFREVRITNCKQLQVALQDDALKQLLNGRECKGIIIDSLTNLMEIAVDDVVKPHKSGLQGWEAYGDYFRDILLRRLPLLNRPVIVISHLQARKEGADQRVVAKGYLTKIGPEAYFNSALIARKMDISELSQFEGDKLHITDDDRIQGYKYVLQTRPTMDTQNSGVRTPMDMFSVKETFIDSDCQQLINCMNSYYES